MTYITAPASIDNQNKKPKRKYASRYRPNHPLASKRGYVRLNRLVLYDKLGGVAAPCHWCGVPLTWPTLHADHVNSDSMDNAPDNLVQSCAGCNILRERGWRLVPKTCNWCGTSYIAKHSHNSATRQFCSRACWDASHASNPPSHGTYSRYNNQKCRCDACREAARLHGIAYRARRRARGLRR